MPLHVRFRSLFAESRSSAIDPIAAGRISSYRSVLGALDFVPDPIVVDAATPLDVRRPTGVSIQLNVAASDEVVRSDLVRVVHINPDWHPFIKTHTSTVSGGLGVALRQKNEIAVQQLVEIDIEFGNRVCWVHHFVSINM